MKCLAFTTKSTYARFRRPYTTTSALTFSVIHPVAVKGLIAAIMGIEHEDFFNYTVNMKIAIQVLNPIYKDMQSFNLIAQANNNDAPNFQSRVEFLRDVNYRIFVSDDQDKLERIKQVIESRSYIFTPYLGCSEHIASIYLEGLYEIQNTSDRFVDTIVPSESVQINEDTEFIVYADRIPIKNNRDRNYVEYSKVLFSNNKLSVKGLDVYKVGEHNVFFL